MCLVQQHCSLVNCPVTQSSGAAAAAAIKLAMAAWRGACVLVVVVQGKSVVRLKGGCPSTFSRVSSEAAALAAAGLAFELVPGVSSATAAAVLAGMLLSNASRVFSFGPPPLPNCANRGAQITAQPACVGCHSPPKSSVVQQVHVCLCARGVAGFPLTDTQLAGAYAVISAHDAGSVDWAAYQHIPTLVLLMGGRQLGTITQQLQATGWPPDTPVSASTCPLHDAHTVTADGRS
jgi:siroheme synthase